jgi:hypothetical protein
MHNHQPPSARITKHHQASPSITHQASPSINKHVHASLSITKHHQASPSITKHHQASPSITKYHQVSPSITKHHQASPSITKHHQASPSITKHHQASPSITHQASLTKHQQKRFPQKKKKLKAAKECAAGATAQTTEHESVDDRVRGRGKRPVVSTGEESPDDLHEPTGELVVFNDGNVDEQASQHLYLSLDVERELYQQASPSILKMRPVVKTGEQSPDDLQGSAGLDAMHVAELEDPDISMEDLWVTLAQNEETSAAAGVTCDYGERVRVTLELWPRAEQVFDEIVCFWASKSCHFKGDHKL